MILVQIELVFVAGLLFAILFYVRHLSLREVFDPQVSVNCYGENFSDAMQNSIVRGQRGISTYD